MIVNGKVVISDDIKENNFLCDLEKCKGACCVEGDLGAPLEEDELEVLDGIYDEVKFYLTGEGRRSIEENGCYVYDEDKEYSTPTINGRECAYSVYDDQGILKCAIELAYLDGKVSFQKPISCHLYPIRLSRYDDYDALNYDRWHICSPACELGNSMQIPLYRFLSEALVRKYGQQWYDNLVQLIESPETVQEEESRSKKV